MLFVLTVLLVVLKLVGVLHISWLLASAPILVGAALLVIGVVLSVIGAALAAAVLSRFTR